MASLSNAEYLTLNEAIRANLHGNKRKLKWRPFWNKVYRGEVFYNWIGSNGFEVNAENKRSLFSSHAVVKS